MSSKECSSCASLAIISDKCKSCYRKEWRIKHINKLLAQEAASRIRNRSALKTQLTKYKYTLKGRFSGLRLESKRRGLEMRLTFEQFVQLYSEPCEYCDREGHDSAGGYRLDRIDNALGYFPENVVPCCGVCNRIRGDRLEFFEMIVAMKAVTAFRRDTKIV